MEDRPDDSGGVHARGALPFFLIYLVSGTGFALALRGGYYTFVAPLAMTFVAVPLFDALIGLDTRNPSDAPPGRLASALFRLATWIAVPSQAALLAWGLWFAIRPEASRVEIVGALLAVGITGGVIGITVAHELVHRASRLDRILGGVLLALVSYLHWGIEHVAGHHRRVATPDDPATARFGEVLPAFMARSVIRGFQSAWQIESARNARRGIHATWRNRVLHGLGISGALAAAIGLLAGPRAMAFFLGQSAVAIAFLETVNYIEHYGLRRRLVSPGVYERVSSLHSWNSAHRLTNALLFNLQRHSDHHVWPARPYHKLRHRPESPQLPTGYAGMALLAMVPPLWRRVMHPRLAALAPPLDPPAREDVRSPPATAPRSPGA
jgi:alkane 1-monooxygenase